MRSVTARLALVALAFGVAIVATDNTLAATTIEFVGLADDAGASGPGVFGTDGYDLYGTSPVGSYTQTHDYNDPFGAGTRIQSLPDYVASVTANGANHSAAGYLYAAINDPATGEPVQSGYAFRFDSINTEKDLLDVNLGEVVPLVFYIGVMNDTGIAPGSDNFETVRVRTAAGADSGLITATGSVNAGVDFYFFKVAGANPGEIITISGVETTQHHLSGMYHLATSGLAFSQTSPVPEPSTLALLGIGVASLLARVFGARATGRPRLDAR